MKSGIEDSCVGFPHSFVTTWIARPRNRISMASIRTENSRGTIKKLLYRGWSCPRLRDPASLLPLAAAASSRNLLTIYVLESQDLPTTF